MHIKKTKKTKKIKKSLEHREMAIFRYSIKMILLAVLYLFVVRITARENCFQLDNSSSNEFWITVVVHGIVNIKPHLSVSNLIRFMRDQITDSIYARAVEIMRVDPFFFQYSAMQGLGLEKIDPTLKREGYASGAFALSYTSFDQLNNQNNEKNIFYTFGWSGLLSTQIRYYEAEIFYRALENEINYYRAQGLNPKVRIIGYSHGGYIALNLGAVFNNKKKDAVDWCVDELILLGVPVISDTDFLVDSLLFKEVYHVYSPGDRVQVVDCLATNRFFSHRIFRSRLGFLLPQKLKQIQFRVKRVAKTRAAKHHCKHHAQEYPAKLLRNADPGHTELWSFGWSMGYRSHLPLYPFPAGVYLGYLINSIKNNYIGNNHLIMDIRPFQEKICISAYDSSFNMVVPFPSKQFHEEVVQQLNPYVPINCSREAYKQRSDHALEIAYEQKKDEWRRRRRCLPRFKKKFMAQKTQKVEC